MVGLALIIGAFLLGRARAPEILRTPTADTGVLWACNGELVGAVALAPGTVRIITEQGQVLTTTVDSHGRLAVKASPPARSGGRARISRGATEIQVPVLACADRPFEKPSP